ncbi:hypothetical protein YC2023_117155 [Brassica napus]
MPTKLKFNNELITRLNPTSEKVPPLGEIIVRVKQVQTTTSSYTVAIPFTEFVEITTAIHPIPTHMFRFCSHDQLMLLANTNIDFPGYASAYI